jgi:NADH:ubiquinone oxidoreductase subunit 4 (subunit M)
MLLMGRRVFFGSLPHRWQNISDVSAGELRVLGGLFGLSLLLGVYPKLLSDILQTIGAS